MRRQGTHGQETRRRLLDAAGVLFAQKGFRDTKTADICRMARANGAAVNYHFRSKADLYVAAWRHAFERSIAAYPPDGGVPAGAPPQERLRGHIRALVGRFMDPDSRDMDIASRELAIPTGLLSEVILRSIEPLRRMHMGIVRELLGPRASERDVRLCQMSIHSQCVIALMHERLRRSAPAGAPHAGPPPLEVGAEALVEHVYRFSLAGLREVRRAAGAAGRGSKEKKP